MNILTLDNNTIKSTLKSDCIYIVETVLREIEISNLEVCHSSYIDLGMSLKVLENRH